jgi:hypothetical protein
MGALAVDHSHPDGASTEIQVGYGLTIDRFY